ncbi:uncharacterized protein CHSO_1801 [Chryseobacterium sp. StRB126]|uniref:lipocalin family protein n=1 Tax=Chryseobacterium sp. StRB126 TaxID=878220 RepID=UPI0004E99A92|nr:lipocalin family protein [Chryseobacterium sp. StRB126]BAP30838.1 uncharacterized protein CHSO_1801 [Chryseobacterium sp. StRB126]
MIKKTLFLSIATLSLFACNNDDNDNNQKIEASIVGKWQPSKYMAYSGKDGSIIASESSDANVCDKKGFIDIAANGKIHEISYYGNAESECKLDTDTTTDYTYDASSKTIQVKYDGSTEVSTIKKLTATELEVIQELTDVNGDGIKDEITAIYKRL